MSRVLWHSVAPWAGSGYGQQTAMFTPRIRDLGHDVALSAFWGLGGSVMGWRDMPVFPFDEQWGNRSLPLYAQMHKADCVITLMDVWVLQAKKMKDLPLACWVPIDQDPAPPKVVKFLKESGAKPIAMSRFGERMLKDEDLDPLYVPHGVDTSVMRPKPENRARTREKMGFPEDAFVIGMVAANTGNLPARKAFPQVIQAFATFRKDHPDAYLYMHTEPTGTGTKAGLFIPHLASQCGLEEDQIRFTNELQYEFGLKPSELADLYSAFDVLAGPSYGEGFGIPIVESQSCGTPVIVTDWTAMTELCGDGWTVGGDPWFNAPQGSFYKCPSVDEIVAAFEAAYEQRGQGPSQDAREFALQYDADRVMKKYWVPALARLGVSMSALKAAA